jgi:NAD-dependent dihydropyrimidine dehydrogenase PreA subunit
MTADKCSCAANAPTHNTGATTLRYNPEKCINCGMCSTVCPHGVFAPNGNVAQLVQPDACMECGACQQNCPTGAITVDSGVGCAAAMIYAALTGREEPSCGGPEPDGCGSSSCCG